MAERPAPASEWGRPARARCRCGHLPTHHMVVAPLPNSANFRLDPSGPCGICGESVCRRFTPGGT